MLARKTGKHYYRSIHHPVSHQGICPGLPEGLEVYLILHRLCATTQVSVAAAPYEVDIPMDNATDQMGRERHIAVLYVVAEEPPLSLLLLRWPKYDWLVSDWPKLVLGFPFWAFCLHVSIDRWV